MKQYKLQLHSWCKIAHNPCSNAGNDPTRQRCVPRPSDLFGRQSRAWRVAATLPTDNQERFHTNEPGQASRSHDRHEWWSNVTSRGGVAGQYDHRLYPKYWRPVSKLGWEVPDYRPTIGVYDLSPVYVHRNLGRPLFSGLHRLAVQNHDTRMGLASRLLPYLHPKRVQNRHPDPALAQFALVIGHRLVWRKVVRQRCPTTSIPCPIKNRIEQFSPRMLHFRSASIAAFGQQWFDFCPFRVTQIRWISFSFFHPFILFGNLFLNSYPLRLNPFSCGSTPLASHPPAGTRSSAGAAAPTAQ